MTGHRFRRLLATGSSSMLSAIAAMAAAQMPSAGSVETYPSPGYRQETVTIPVGGVRLAGRLVFPDGPGPHPAAVLIAGSGDSRNLPGLAEHLAQHGIAALDLQKRGVGGSSGRWDRQTFRDRADDVARGLEYLRLREDIAAARVGVVGHSQGGWIAQIVAADRADVAFVALLAGPAQTVKEQILTEARIYGERRQVPDEQLERELSALRRQLDWADRAAPLCRTLRAHYICNIVEFDPASHIERIETPVLALYAELDPMVPPEPNIGLLLRGLERSANPDVTVRVFPQANHGFWKARTGLSDEYHELDPTYVPGFLEEISAWIIARTDTVGGEPSNPLLPDTAQRSSEAVQSDLEPAGAKVERRRDIGVSAGAFHVAQQDLIHSPFVHGGGSPISLALRYRSRGSWSHALDIYYGSVSSRRSESYPILYDDHSHEHGPHVYVYIEAAYGLGRAVVLREIQTATVGAAARVDLQPTFYQYGLEENFGYFMATSLDLWYQHDLEPTVGHHVSGRLSAPVLSWVARSPYLVNDDTFVENIASNDALTTALAFLHDGGFAGWDRLQRFNLLLEYRRYLSRRFGIGVEYRLDFLRSVDPRPLISLRNGVALTTTLGL